MIRTLAKLNIGTRKGGKPCLRGELARALTLTDDEGRERNYPAGTGLMLIKHADDTYSLVAMLPDDEQQNYRDFEAARQAATAEPWEQPF